MSADLTPYVPRVLLQWDERYGDAKHREIDGTLVFADVSGFTRLSERLARAGGKVGAEQMTDVINSLFGDLLMVAARRGGEMLKYGGDAMLLFFPGEGHAPRAAAACAEMQARLGEIGRVDTGAGVVRLRMSVGVHSGAFDFFVVGRSHQELVVAGPAATTTVAMEAAADAGEVLLSPATAALLDRTVVGAAKAGGRLLRRPPEAPLVPTEPVPPAASAERFLSVGLREYLKGGVVDAEHRLVTIGFLHVMGVDALLDPAGPGPAAAAERLDDTLTVVQEMMAAFGVTFLATDIAPDGTKAMVAAGAPLTAEEPEERMLRALRRVVESRTPLPVRAGVHRGHVFTGDVGPPYRRTYTAIGDVTNTAARIMGPAAPGEVLTLSPVIEQVRSPYQVEQLEPFVAKGKAEPLVPLRVGALDQAGPAVDLAAADAPARPPLVGRDAELEVLLATAAGVTRGEGRLVEVVGEMGLGKSRLVEEAVARCEGFPALVLRCEPYEQSTPFFPFRHLLRRVLRLNGAEPDAALAALQAVVAEQAPELVPLVPLVAGVLDLDAPETEATRAIDPRFRRQQTNAAVADLLGVLIDEPTIVVFEDVHWADDASSDLLRHLEALVVARPWLIVPTRRDEERGFHATPGTTTTTSLRLAPLLDEHVEELVQHATAAAPVPPYRRDEIVRRAGGNPLFAEALVRSAAGSGAEALPDSVEAVVAAEIDTLPPRDRKLLRSAAVLGSSFEVKVLAEVVEGAGDSVGADARAVARRLNDLVVAETRDRLRFRHELLRDVAYEGLAYRDRRALHARASVVIEQQLGDRADDRTGVLSLHCWHAREYDRCWRWARTAGGRALEKYAHVEAVELLARALASAPFASPPLADVAAVNELLGEARAYLGELERAREAFRAARRLRLDDPPAFARLCRKEARIAQQLGSNVASVRWIKKGLRTLDGRADGDAACERAELLVFYAWTRQSRGEARAALRWAKDALDEGARAGNRSAVAAAHVLLSGARQSLGLPDDGSGIATALEIYDDLGTHADRAVVLNTLGMHAYYRGDWAAAVDLYGRSRDGSAKAGNLVDAGYGMYNIAEILVDQGRLDDAEAAIDEVARLWRSVSYGAGLTFARALEGRLRLRRRDVDRAAELLASTRESVLEQGMRGFALMIDVSLAECEILGDRAGDAQRRVEDALAADRSYGGTASLPGLLRMRAYALGATGHADEARAGLRESLQVARDKGATYDVALALDGLAALGAVDTGEVEERDRILRDLGVVATPPPPLRVAAAR